MCSCPQRPFSTPQLSLTLTDDSLGDGKLKLDFMTMRTSRRIGSTRNVTRPSAAAAVTSASFSVTAVSSLSIGILIFGQLVKFYFLTKLSTLFLFFGLCFPSFCSLSLLCEGL